MAASPVPTLEISVLDPLAGEQWDLLSRDHPDATIFHSSNWARVLARTYGHQPHYLRFERSGETVALVPLMEVNSRWTGRRGVCLPFSDFCSPLIFDPLENAAILAKLCEITADRGWKYCELRGGLAAGNDDDSAAALFYGHELDLTRGIEQLFANLSTATRGGVRKARSSGLEAEIRLDAGAMGEYYRLHCLTRRRHGVPPQPWRFFQNIHNEIVAAGLGFVVTVRHGKSPLAAAVFFSWRGSGLFKFAASDASAQKLRPNNLCLWRGIEHLVQVGCHTFQLGRTDLGNEGLRRFKRSWGAVENPIRYDRLSATTKGHGSTKRSGTGRLYKHLFRRLPLAVNSAAGAFLYRHLD